MSTGTSAWPRRCQPPTITTPFTAAVIRPVPSRFQLRCPSGLRICRVQGNTPVVSVPDRRTPPICHRPLGIEGRVSQPWTACNPKTALETPDLLSALSASPQFGRTRPLAPCCGTDPHPTPPWVDGICGARLTALNRSQKIEFYKMETDLNETQDARFHACPGDRVVGANHNSKSNSRFREDNCCGWAMRRLLRQDGLRRPQRRTFVHAPPGLGKGRKRNRFLRFGQGRRVLLRRERRQVLRDGRQDVCELLRRQAQHGPDGLLLRQRKQDNGQELLRWRAV